MNMPLLNQQPEWLNVPANSDSTANQSDSSADQNIGTVFINAPPPASFFNISWVSNPAPITIVGSLNYVEAIVCQRHRTTYRQTITFDIDGTQETYCLGCIRDAIRERVAPINQSEMTDSAVTEPTFSKEPVQRFSRYDLIKGRDATGI